MSSASLVLGAVGDIMLARGVASQMQAKGNDWLLECIQPVLSRADMLFGNLESPVLPADTPASQIDPLALVSCYDGTGALETAGFDIVTLANNHVLDGGTTGMFHTRQVLLDHGIAVAGVGQTQDEARQPAILECNGLRVGFLCYAEDSNYTLGTPGPCHAYFTADAALEDIHRWRSEVDALVVSVHGDLEFMDTPSPPRRDTAQRLVEAGATLILQHHPHVPQGLEQIGSSLIAYSLGNFCFDAHSHPYMRQHLPRTAWSFVLMVEIGPDGVRSFHREPFEIAPPPDQRPVPLTGSRRDEKLARLNELDAMVQDDRLLAENWTTTALTHLNLHLRRLARLEDADAIYYTLGKLLLVAENQGWTQEVLRFLRDHWRCNVQRTDPYRRPSYSFLAFDRPRRVGWPRRAGRVLRRIVRAVRRRLFRAR